MAFSPEEVRRYAEAYRQAFHEGLSDDDAGPMLERLVHLQRRLSEVATELPQSTPQPIPGTDPPKLKWRTVVVYVVRRGEVLAFVESAPGPSAADVLVPAGAVHDGETPEAAALRALQRKVVAAATKSEHSSASLNTTSATKCMSGTMSLSSQPRACLRCGSSRLPDVIGTSSGFRYRMAMSSHMISAPFSTTCLRQRGGRRGLEGLWTMLIALAREPRRQASGGRLPF